MNRKINIDRPDLSSKEIASRQDFSSLMKQLPKASKPPFYKTGWFITTVASVAGIAVITTNFILNDKNPTLNQELATSASTETPPPKETSNYLASNTTVIDNDTSIEVAFVNEPKASEIAVVQENQPEEKGTEYSDEQYQQNIELKKAELVSAKTAYEEALNVRVAFEKSAPTKPVSNGNKDRQFILDISPKEFPELAMYKNLLFEVEADDPNFSPSVYKEAWEGIELKTNVPGKTYFLSLHNDYTSKTFSVFPVYQGNDLTTAMQKYENELSKYNQQLNILLEKEENLKEKYDKQSKKLMELENQETNLSKTN